MIKLHTNGQKIFINEAAIEQIEDPGNGVEKTYIRFMGGAFARVDESPEEILNRSPDVVSIAHELLKERQKISDDLGFMEWSTSKEAEDFLKGLIELYYESDVIKRAESFFKGERKNRSLLYE